jgi:hypothetical protein
MFSDERGYNMRFFVQFTQEVHPGDFVEVMAGPFQGQSGWVEGGWSNVVHIAVENSLDDVTEIHDIKVGSSFNCWHSN